MCGICFIGCKCIVEDNELRKRGPNCFSAFNSNFGQFIGCVLQQQDIEIVKQPIIKADNIFLWNGENYENEVGNDGVNILSSISNMDLLSKITYISLIDGPFSFIYFEESENRLLFGRDVLGRRSLLMGLDFNNNIMCLSNVVIENCTHVVRWVEVPAVGIYSCTITMTNSNSIISNIELYRYNMYSFEYVAEQLATISLQSEWSIFAPNSFVTKYDFDINNVNCDDILEVFYSLLYLSVQKRIKSIFYKCSNCYDIPEVKCTGHSKLGILFSGGVDSAVLAALADKFIPISDSIDLLNVAFETDKEDCSCSPDRISGLKCLEELKRNVNPNRKWNFVKIDVKPEELRKEREKCIKKLIKPCETVLDDSIGCAIWFAARGSGVIENDQEKYTSSARVVFTGIGADELLAGYSRHRNTYRQYGYDGVEAELSMEIRRIYRRNMGRDDRVISSHGRESRFPFLDSNLVSFLQKVPITEKCDLEQPRGIGEKLLLRKLASEKLGLKNSSCHEKRAIQFGSRIAKVDKLKKGAKASKKSENLIENSMNGV